MYYYPNPIPAILDAIIRSLISIWDPSLWEGVWRTFLSWYILVVALLSIILSLLIIIIFKKVSKLISAYQESSIIISSAEDVSVPESSRRWEHVLELVRSDNPNDWRLSILEADIMLDELVSRMGYKGEGLGEKLKNIEKPDFRTLDDAWEAHKVRNIIAHRGSDYVLTQREANRIITLFTRVFEEFHYI